MLAQLPVADHVLDFQGFDADNLVFVDQSAGQLVQVVRSAIGNLGVNTSYLYFGFGAVLGAELLFAQPLLRLRKLRRVLRRVAGIAGFLSRVGHEQISDPEIDPNRAVDHGHRFRLKLAKARDEIPPCRIFGNGNGAGRTWQISRPANIQRFFALCDIQFAVAVTERRGRELRRLLARLLFEGRVLRTALEKVLEGGLLMPQALLKGNAGYFPKPVKLRFLFERGQIRTRRAVPDLLFALVERIGAPAQGSVVDKTNAPEGPRKQHLLLGGRVESEFERSLSHTWILHRFAFSVNPFYPALKGEVSGA